MMTRRNLLRRTLAAAMFAVASRLGFETAPELVIEPVDAEAAWAYGEVVMYGAKMRPPGDPLSFDLVEYWYLHDGSQAFDDVGSVTFQRIVMPDTPRRAEAWEQLLFKCHATVPGNRPYFYYPGEPEGGSIVSVDALAGLYCFWPNPKYTKKGWRK